MKREREARKFRSSQNGDQPRFQDNKPSSMGASGNRSTNSVPPNNRSPDIRSSDGQSMTSRSTDDQNRQFSSGRSLNNGSFARGFSSHRRGLASHNDRYVDGKSSSTRPPYNRAVDERSVSQFNRARFTRNRSRGGSHSRQQYEHQRSTQVAPTRPSTKRIHQGSPSNSSQRSKLRRSDSLKNVLKRHPR